MPRKPTGQLIERKTGWFARYLATVDGVRKHVSVDLETRNALIARRKLDTLLAAEQAGAVATLVETFAQAAERVHETRVRTKPSAKSEISLIRTWAVGAIGAIPAPEVTRADVEAVLEAARDAGKSQGTLVHIRNAIAAAYKQLKREGVVADLPVPAIADLPEALAEACDDRPKAILTEAEFLAYLGHSPAFTAPRTATRERQMMTLLSLAGGMRTGELHGLTWARADVDGRAFAALEVVRYKTRRKAVRAGSKAQVRQLYPLADTVLPLFLRYWWLRCNRPPHGIDAVQDAQKRRLRRLRGGLGPAGGKGEGVCMAYPPGGMRSPGFGRCSMRRLRPSRPSRCTSCRFNACSKSIASGDTSPKRYSVDCNRRRCPSR
jgi:integrase